MKDAGIQNGDILIVDRAIKPSNNSIVIAVINGELTVKRLYYKSKKLYLKPDNANHRSIEVTEDMDFNIWGTVTYSIHSVI